MPLSWNEIKQRAIAFSRNWKGTTSEMAEASDLMARLHDELFEEHLPAKHLHLFLTRVLFCLLADGTAIFPSASFKVYLDKLLARDLGILGAMLEHLFRVLNQPKDQRQKALPADLGMFPYLNLELFAEPNGILNFSPEAYYALTACREFDWSRVRSKTFEAECQREMKKRHRAQLIQRA